MEDLLSLVMLSPSLVPAGLLAEALLTGRYNKCVSLNTQSIPGLVRMGPKQSILTVGNITR